MPEDITVYVTKLIPTYLINKFRNFWITSLGYTDKNVIRNYSRKRVVYCDVVVALLQWHFKL